MSFQGKSYRSNDKNRIGRLNQRLKIHAYLSEQTSHGGEQITYTLWKETFAKVEQGGTNESFAADRETAFNSKKFIIRYLSCPQIDPKMIVEHDGFQYDITAITELLDTPNKHYRIINATRRDDNVVIANLLDNIMIHQFTQRNQNISGVNVPVTAGQLLNPIGLTDEVIDTRLRVYRSGLRMLYNLNYTIVNGVIRLNQRLRKENVFIEQYIKQ